MSEMHFNWAAGLLRLAFVLGIVVMVGSLATAITGYEPFTKSGDATPTVRIICGILGLSLMFLGASYLP